MTCTKSHMQGFTLIELMVTVAISAILATVAVSSYKSQVQKSRRTDAKSALLDLATREQKLYSLTNVYGANPADVGYPGTAWPQTVGSGYYQVSVTVVAATASAPATFTATATPVGSQATDSQCASFTVNNLGQQTAANSVGALNSSCW